MAFKNVFLRAGIEPISSLLFGLIIIILFWCITFKTHCKFIIEFRIIIWIWLWQFSAYIFNIKSLQEFSITLQKSLPQNIINLQGDKTRFEFIKMRDLVDTDLDRTAICVENPALSVLCTRVCKCNFQLERMKFLMHSQGLPLRLLSYFDKCKKLSAVLMTK